MIVSSKLADPHCARPKTRVQLRNGEPVQLSQVIKSGSHSACLHRDRGRMTQSCVACVEFFMPVSLKHGSNFPYFCFPMPMDSGCSLLLMMSVRSFTARSQVHLFPVLMASISNSCRHLVFAAEEFVISSSSHRLAH